VIVLIGGGSRSGKSRYALEYAERYGTPRTFIATAEAHDDEMRQRILVHQRDRGASWITREEPIELGSAIGSSDGGAIVVDCLTLWVSNLMFAGRDVRDEGERMLEAAVVHTGTIVLVTNEVGCGIVPDNELARRFRDLAGNLNQRAAAAAQEVWFMAFGCSLRLK